LVDSKHIRDHIEDSSECKEQLAFADVILLNKTDLVDEKDLANLEQKIHLMNSEAKVFRTVNAATDIKHLLKIGGFDIDRALEIRPSFLEPEFPFEWAGTLHLKAGNYSLRLQPGPDPSIKLFITPSLASGEEAISLLQKDAILAFSAKDEILLENGKVAHPSSPFTLKIEESNSTTVELSIAESGNYVFFSEHYPNEFEMKLLDHERSALSFTHLKAFKPEHEHEEDITSVGVEFPGLLDPRVFQPWISLLLKTKGADIFRSKGVLHFVGEPRRYVFQGVHMLMKGEFDEIPSNGHLNRLVFIGRNLDRTTLVEGFKACLAKT
jgi:G3E family GTPase